MLYERRENMKKHIVCKLLCLLCVVTAVGLSAVLAMAADSTGGLVITGGSEGTDYVWRGDRLIILTDTPVTIQNRYAAEELKQTILIDKNKSANVTLGGVNIKAEGETPAIQIDGAEGNVTLTLKGENVLRGGNGRAAIEKNGLTGKLTLTGDGSLTAIGGAKAPGIGVNDKDTHIEFAGGVITAIGGKGSYADIGNDGNSNADIRISSTASVKGSCSERPFGLSLERIVQYILPVSGNRTVKIDGTDFPYRKHLDENRLYLWLSVGNHTVENETLSIEDPECGLKVTGGVEGKDYLYNGGEIRILTAKPMTVSNTDPASPTKDMIYVAKDVNADLTLAGVNIESRGGLRIADDSRGNVQIRLAEGTENKLSASVGAGLQKNGMNGSLTISGRGKLEVRGGDRFAGIGGGITNDYEGNSCDTTNITIADGNVTVYGSDFGAGIGGGIEGNTGNLTISGGVVEVFSGGDSAAIGAGYRASVDSINITGGTVIAHAKNSYATAIGGGYEGKINKISISGGDVTAYSGGGAAIGAGHLGVVNLIEITGGTVTATGGAMASAIGSGVDGTVESIRISGGTVKTYYAWNCVGIGSGEEGHTGEIAITGGTVTLENSSPEWHDPATEWFALGSDNKDDIKIIIKDCLLTTDGGIGCRNGGKLSVMIGKNASVRAAALHAQAVNESGAPVYPILIENPKEETVKVDGEVFPYITNPGEKALCPYRPGKDISVTVGNETNIIPFDEKTRTFSTVHIPADERIGVRKADCTHDGYTGDLYCIGCGALLEKGESIPCSGHDCTITVTREATLTKPGEVQMYCKVCGANYKAAQRFIGDFIVSGIENDDDVAFSGGVLKILKNRTLMIQNIHPNEPTTAQIAVADGVQARLILNGVQIDARSADAAAISAAEGSSGDVRIELADGSLNQLYSGSECAGLQKNGGSGTLTITGNGTLIAVGGNGAAGIGSGKGHLLRNLTIKCGNISAAGGNYGAGIGSGQNFSAENISITGGMVTAIGGTKACGIGHGYNYINFTSTKNLVIGPMASVKADGPSGALGTTPVNEKGEQVFLRQIEIPENSRLLIGRKVFPYTYHDGEAKVYVYLTSEQTVETNLGGVASPVPEDTDTKIGGSKGNEQKTSQQFVPFHLKHCLPGYPGLRWTKTPPWKPTVYWKGRFCKSNTYSHIFGSSKRWHPLPMMKSKSAAKRPFKQSGMRNSYRSGVHIHVR